jgi:hypothetical protein
MWTCTKCHKVGPRSRISCPACGEQTKSLDNDGAVFGVGFLIGSIVAVVLLFILPAATSNAPAPSASPTVGMYACVAGGLIGGAVFTLAAALHRGFLGIYAYFTQKPSGIAENCRDGAVEANDSTRLQELSSLAKTDERQSEERPETIFDKTTPPNKESPC